MATINYKLLQENNISDADYHTLIKISQQEVELLKEEMFPELLAKDLIRFNKSPKDAVKAVRLSKKGKEFLRKVELATSDPKLIDFCDQLCDLYDSYGIPTGNKVRVLDNLEWFVTKTNFDTSEVEQGIDSWLSNGYKVWLENLFWDRKRANVYTTMASRTLGQSPLYEFMRREQGLQW